MIETTAPLIERTPGEIMSWAAREALLRRYRQHLRQALALAKTVEKSGFVLTSACEVGLDHANFLIEVGF